MSGSTCVAIKTLLIKLAIISHRKSVIRFDSTISLLRKLIRDFLFCYFNCVIEDTLINFLGVLLIENAPKRSVLCVRENPEVFCLKSNFPLKYVIVAHVIPREL